MSLNPRVHVGTVLSLVLLLLESANFEPLHTVQATLGINLSLKTLNTNSKLMRNVPFHMPHELRDMAFVFRIKFGKIVVISEYPSCVQKPPSQ